MSRIIRASETLLFFFFFLVFRVLDAKRSSSGAEADVAPSRRRRHGRHRIKIYREKVSSSKKKADEESSPLYLGYHFLYKNPKLFSFKKPEEEEEGKKKRAKESEYVVFLTLLDRR